MLDRLAFRRRLVRLTAVMLAGICAVVLGLWSPTADARIPSEQIETTETVDEALVFRHLRRYQPGVDVMAERGPELIGDVRQGLGLEEISSIEVWVLPRVVDYFDYHQLDERPADWTVGLSFSDEGEIIVAHGGERTRQQAMKTFAHELAHVGIDQARDGQPVPRWFHEGFAVMTAEQWDHERSERLARAAAGDNLTPFDKLWDQFPAHQMSSALAYDQSFHFVRWLRSEYGDDLFARVLDEVDDETSFRGGLEAETGEEFASLEARWRDSLAGTTSFWSILRDDLTIFFGAAFLFVITYFVARRRRRRQLEEMDEDEPDRRWDYDESRYPLPGKGEGD